MGVKEGLMNKMISSMIGKVDFNAIQKQLGQNGGKIDANMINSVMSSMLGNKGNGVANNVNNNKHKAETQTITQEDEIAEIVKKKTFGFQDICKILPQRPPFLMIDRVLDINLDAKTIVCEKNLSANEGFFVGHFPGNPVFPGVLMVEAAAQASSILGKALLQGKQGILVFAEIENAKFSSVLVPGDVMTVEAKVTKMRDPVIVGECVVKKGKEIVCQATIKAFRKEM